MKKKSKNSFFNIPMEERPVSKVIGKKCGACTNFGHPDIQRFGRIKATQKHQAGVGLTFGRCEALDADDAISAHRACAQFMEAQDR